MSKPKICLVMAQYNQLDYTEMAIESFFKNTTGADTGIILVDDCSPEYDNEWACELTTKYNVTVIRNEKNLKLTASLNLGFNYIPASFQDNETFVGIVNNDILFSPYWHKPLIRALKSNKFHLVGPCSNAPGVTARGFQDVRLYTSEYELSDTEESIARIRNHIGERDPVETKINGFFMFSSYHLWRSGAYQDDSAELKLFECPIPVMPSGRRNPTPWMTGQEDELQSRWKKKGRRMACCPDSFIFHYRSVSRGDQHRHGQWLRKKSQS